MLYGTEREIRSDIQGYTNNFSCRGSTVMFDLSKYVSQLCLCLFFDVLDWYLIRKE